MSSASAGQVLGPRPGLAIMSFWQGKVEICLRLVAIVVGSFPAMVAAAHANGAVKSDEIDSAASFSEEVSDTRDPDTLEITGYTIGLVVLAIVTQILVILIRFLNIGLINLHITVFHAIDIMLNIFFVLGHVAGGIALAVIAADWDDVCDDLCVVFPTERPMMPGMSNPSDEQLAIEMVRDSMWTGAVFCFVATVLFALLVMWMFLFLIMKWNEKSGEVKQSGEVEAVTA